MCVCVCSIQNENAPSIQRQVSARRNCRCFGQASHLQKKPLSGFCFSALKGNLMPPVGATVPFCWWQHLCGVFPDGESTSTCTTVWISFTAKFVLSECCLVMAGLADLLRWRRNCAASFQAFIPSPLHLQRGNGKKTKTFRPTCESVFSELAFR